MTIKTTIFTHRLRVSLARFSFCWWRHNRLLMTSQWPDNCDTIMWIVISNSLDIDCIHGDIHGLLCKKNGYKSDWGERYSFHIPIYCSVIYLFRLIPDSRVHGANMGPTWVLSAPNGPHVGSMNLVIRDNTRLRLVFWSYESNWPIRGFSG